MCLCPWWLLCCFPMFQSRWLHIRRANGVLSLYRRPMHLFIILTIEMLFEGIKHISCCAGELFFVLNNGSTATFTGANVDVVLALSGWPVAFRIWYLFFSKGLTDHSQKHTVAAYWGLYYIGAHNFVELRIKILQFLPDNFWCSVRSKSVRLWMPSNSLKPKGKIKLYVNCCIGIMRQVVVIMKPKLWLWRSKV